MTAAEESTRARVCDEVRRWIGTPYHHHARVRGVGVDCAMLLAEVYEAAGVTEHVDVGHYAPDWHLHRNDEIYMQWLARYGRRLDVGVLPRAGDVALFQFGRCYAHGAIVVDIERTLTCVHAYLNRGVLISRVDEEPLLGRPVNFWTFW